MIGSNRKSLADGINDRAGQALVANDPLRPNPKLEALTWRMTSCCRCLRRLNSTVERRLGDVTLASICQCFRAGVGGRKLPSHTVAPSRGDWFYQCVSMKVSTVLRFRVRNSVICFVIECTVEQPPHGHLPAFLRDLPTSICVFDHGLMIRTR